MDSWHRSEAEAGGLRHVVQSLSFNEYLDEGLGILAEAQRQLVVSCFFIVCVFGKIEIGLSEHGLQVGGEHLKKTL